jgi:hypothetical protein
VNAFKKECLEINSSENILNAEEFELFFLHWTQKTKSGDTIKQQQEKTWNTKLRLKTWARNSSNWDKKPQIKKQGSIPKLR